MENFYIFLDIDGVLWDKAFAEENQISILDAENFYFKPESMQALNYIISNVSNDYNPVLVLSSDWRLRREHFNYIAHLLNKSGLEYCGIMEKTPRRFSRGQEIYAYLKKHKEFKNYLVIDDNVTTIKGYVDHDKIIQTDGVTGALSLKQAEQFVKDFNKVYGYQDIK